KYVGDSIMALFPKADEAVQASIAMLHTLRAYNMTRGTDQRPKLQIGIGIHTGTLMLGTIGGEHRMDSTVIADAVNLASRLESTTKTYGSSLIISQNTLKRLDSSNKYLTRFLDDVKVKGRSEKINIFEIFDADEPQIKEDKLATLEKFERAVNLYQEYNFTAVKKLMQECLKVNPKDKVATTYIKRCQNFLQVRQDNDWVQIAQAVQWTPDLMINHAEIDAQHKELFAQIKNLILSIGSNDTECVVKTISFLEEYVIYHFTAEEKLMLECNYVGYSEHKIAHEYFKKNFEYIKKYYQQNGESLYLSMLIRDQVIDWLVNHIKIMDQELVSFI
ncbi:bacteriohemerythrin, partial [Thiotrichales bacterium HSG1]|nr:bacteriohemerythrin [Thiotrichales bacterium HSG1]